MLGPTDLAAFEQLERRWLACELEGRATSLRAVGPSGSCRPKRTSHFGNRPDAAFWGNVAALLIVAVLTVWAYSMLERATRDARASRGASQVVQEHRK